MTKSGSAKKALLGVDRHGRLHPHYELGQATESEIAKASRPTLNKVNLKHQRVRADFDSVLFTVTANLEAVRLIVNEWKRFVDSYEDRNGPRIGKAAFKADWKWIRLRVGLQDRLLVEQILYDKGGFYRELVTGFRPVPGSDG